MSNSKNKNTIGGKTLQNVGRKFLKKMGAACLTSALIVSSVCSGVAVSASTTLLRGDINGDQTVNTADIALLHSYKNGGYNFSIDRLDVDGNGIFVFEDDLAYLTNYVFGNGTPTNKTVYDQTATSQGTHYYVKWTYTNGLYGAITIYSKNIPAPGVTTSNQIAPMSIIGVDNRVTYNNNAVVEIGTYQGGVFSRIGSAFIIGEDRLATAAHCVIGVMPTQHLYIKCQGGTLYPLTYASIPNEYWDDNTQAYDYALIKVATNGVDLSEEYGAFTLGLLTDDKKNNIIMNSANNIMVAGWSGGTLQIGSGNLLTSTTDNQLYYTSDTEPGDSGGPIFYDIDGIYNSVLDRVVIGVHVAGSTDDTDNVGSRMNTRSYWFFKQTI